jgi:hypothetical protein
MFDFEIIQIIKQILSSIFLMAFVYFLLTLSPAIRKKYSVFNPYASLNIQQGVFIILNIFRYILLAGSLYFIVDLSLTVVKLYPLWVNPHYSEGKITSYKQHFWRSRSGKLPIIEFRTTTGIKVVFTDKVEIRTAKAHDHDRVPVIYAENDPQNARVDNGLLLTWFDFYLILIGTVASIWGLMRLSKSNISVMVSRVEKWNT